MSRSDTVTVQKKDLESVKRKNERKNERRKKGEGNEDNARARTKCASLEAGWTDCAACKVARKTPGKQVL